MSMEQVMPSSHLLLCCPLLLQPSNFPSISVFSNESALCIRWSKYCSFSISLSKEYSGLIYFRINWFDLIAVPGTLKSLQSWIESPGLFNIIRWHFCFGKVFQVFDVHFSFSYIRNVCFLMYNSLFVEMNVKVTKWDFHFYLDLIFTSSENSTISNWLLILINEYLERLKTQCFRLFANAI